MGASQSYRISISKPGKPIYWNNRKDDVAFALENQNMPYHEMKQRVNRALEMVGMSRYADHDPSRLSGGQKQRVAIAGLLALQPAIIVLDEAMVMLDPKSRQEFMRFYMICENSSS